MDEYAKLERLKQTVLREYPRLGLDDTFQFRCHPGLACFNQCCGDVTIVLTPYDIIRLKQRLGLSSEEFLRRYTFVPFTREQRLPVVVLKMNDDAGRRCPFVSEAGCTIYDARPWACRIYPLGLASPRGPAAVGQAEFYFLLQESPCDGHQEPRRWTVRQWLQDQGIEVYNAMGELFQEVVHHEWLLAGNDLDPAKMEMFYLACYNVDKFRRFVFESTFLKRFEVAPAEVERLRTDDVELMKFAFRWLKFSLFGEKTLTIREGASGARTART